MRVLGRHEEFNRLRQMYGHGDPLRSAPSLLPVWPQDGDRLGKWQERTTNFAGQTDLPAMANQIRAFGLRQIDPTGKSLLIFRNRVKPRNQKYLLLRQPKSHAYPRHP